VTTLAAAGLLMGVCAGCGDAGDADADPQVEARAQCASYREVVASIHFGAEDQDLLAADLEAAGAAAKAAAEATAVESLGASGQEYETALRGLAAAYGDAVAAINDRDDRSYFEALDLAKPLDQDVDELAAELGFESCTPGAPLAGERLLNQPRGYPGTPAMHVPAQANQQRTAEFALSLALDARGEEVLSILRGPSTDATDVGADLERYEQVFGGDFDTFEPIGESGGALVAAREYEYEASDQGDAVAGTMHLFAGLGQMWALDCRSHLASGPSAALQGACDRAIETTRFLMF
jgi:hypothetical protein